MLADALKDWEGAQVSSGSDRLITSVVDFWKAKTRVRKADKEGVPGPETRFRASSIHLLCPRMYFLAKAHQKPVRSSITTATWWRFAIGTGYHYAIQNEILSDLVDPTLFGWWLCQACGQLIRWPEPFIPENPNTTWLPKPAACPQCGKDRFEYREVELENQEFGVRGHCDGILLWQSDRVEVLEIKTIGEYGFPSVDPAQGGSPMEQHIEQAHVYMWLTGLQFARLLYVRKADSNLQSLAVEHEVERKAYVVETILKRVRASREVLRGAVKDTPGRIYECYEPLTRRARQCPMVDLCFPEKL